MQPSKPDTDAGYLDAASRIIFMGGLNRQVVENKWPAFQEVFHDFDIERVASMTSDDIDQLEEDDRIIRYRRKLEAVVKNAKTMRDIAEEEGSFQDYVDDLFEQKGLDGAAKELSKQFSYISEQGAKHWLYATGYPIESVSEKVQQKYAPFGN